jgi:hypothetical protein
VRHATLVARVRSIRGLKATDESLKGTDDRALKHALGACGDPS